jgi:hypothetical protein
MTSNVLVIAFLWIVVVMLNIASIIILWANRSFLAVIAPMLAITIFLSIFNAINLLKVYKDFLALTDESIVINSGLIGKKKTLKLSDIKSVKYGKNKMIFYMTNGAKKSISLAFISKRDEIAIYNYLLSKSVNIVL